MKISFYLLTKRSSVIVYDCMSPTIRKGLKMAIGCRIFFSELLDNFNIDL